MRLTSEPDIEPIMMTSDCIAPYEERTYCNDTLLTNSKVHDCTFVLIAINFLLFKDPLDSLKRGLLHPSFFKAAAVHNILQCTDDDKSLYWIEKLSKLEKRRRLYDLSFF